ncbi:uncharacterized protein PITG_04592 [Phytophthora infestans T30-4]|uniref:Amino acid transporter transmembrane domain-containing protein n=1 Tax=Phytophthora infestans (strain T30-4) TaxID=403677 RepID=D0N1L0_PHYIT|nr:uncharacterized protein PITG_04592 [Phytophthora infestans T30-4]EEY68189.1 conserved hypothetical protein [Phytophthora infestans T30-4]|eukprot:XP_002905348.1 conserved hypothetical protein [Phytophthora infestans T30-4]
MRANALLYAHVHAAARAEFEARALGAGSKFVGFQALARRAGGAALGYSVSLIMASGVYGGCVGNIQIIRDLTPFVAKLMDDGVSELTESGQENVKQIIMWALLAVVLLPLCMLRKLSALQPTNYATSDLPSLQGNSFTRLAQSLSIYNFAFIMTLNLLPLFVQLLKSNGGSSNTRRGGAIRNPTTFVTAPSLLATRSQMTRCIFGATFICAALYGAMGCAAFSLYGDHIDGNILLNLQSDPVIKFPLVATYLAVLLTFPLLFLPLPISR